MFKVILITIIIFIVVIRILVLFKDLIKFFLTGHDYGFHFSEINTLWKLAKKCNLEEPAALFISVPTLNNAISSYIKETKSKGNSNTKKVQDFLTKLYDFRTRLNIDHENKKGLDSTKYLDKGQRLRIILPGHGLFFSEILNNGYEIVIKIPIQKNIIKLTGDDWVGKNISVYLWRKGDASYVFDTRVTNSGIFNGTSVIYLAQTNKLLRAQKRKSVRCQCNLPASLYFIKSEIIDFNLVEVEPGYRVILEDISEDGAMIRVGGQGINNSQIKLQFKIGEKLILMYGIVRAVEYNKTINQSRLHFECLHLEKEMKNDILSFVYNVLPPEQKDVFDALSATEEDRAEDETAPQESSENNVETELVKPIQEITDEIQAQQISLDELAELDVE